MCIANRLLSLFSCTSLLLRVLDTAIGHESEQYHKDERTGDQYHDRNSDGVDEDLLSLKQKRVFQLGEIEQRLFNVPHEFHIVCHIHFRVGVDRTLPERSDARFDPF